MAGHSGEAGYSSIPAEKQTESGALIARLDVLRKQFSEISSSAGSAADKVVGAQPTPISTERDGGTAVRSIPTYFMANLENIVIDLEKAAGDTMAHVNRFHRVF